MADKEHSMLFGGNQASQPSSEQLELISKWVAIFAEHHHKEISELGMATYIEGLKDLPAHQIAYGCELALKEVDRMPTVPHIRERINRYCESVLWGQRIDQRGCELCDFTGWKMVNHPDGVGMRATKCDCRRDSLRKLAKEGK